MCLRIQKFLRHSLCMCSTKNISFFSDLLGALCCLIMPSYDLCKVHSLPIFVVDFFFSFYTNNRLAAVIFCRLSAVHTKLRRKRERWIPFTKMRFKIWIIQNLSNFDRNTHKYATRMTFNSLLSLFLYALPGIPTYLGDFYRNRKKKQHFFGDKMNLIDYVCVESFITACYVSILFGLVILAHWPDNEFQKFQ